MSGPLSERVYLVTGASRGLGRAVALALAEAGARLVLVARTVGALEELDDAQRALSGEAALLVPLDLTDLEAIDRLGAALYERFGKLDGLCAAAAQLTQLSPLGHLPPPVWEATLKLNATANYRLIRSFDPLLRRSEAARAVFVTDRNGRHKAYWNAYDASKAALEAAVLSYAGELNKTSVRINLAAPAPFASRLRTVAFPGEDPKRLRGAEAVAAALLPLLLPSCERQGEVVEI